MLVNTSFEVINNNHSFINQNIKNNIPSRNSSKNLLLQFKTKKSVEIRDNNREFGKNIKNLTAIGSNINYKNNLKVSRYLSKDKENNINQQNIINENIQKELLNPKKKNRKIVLSNSHCQSCPKSGNNNNNNIPTHPTDKLKNFETQILRENISINNITLINTEKIDKIPSPNKKNKNNLIINKNPQNVDEYIDDIISHFYEVESDFLPIPNYMNNQEDINQRMRSILLDWLIDVHLKYKLVPETYYITINLIDRFLSSNVIMRNKLQLIGVTAMFIASKYEDIYPPEVRDFVYITDNAYTKQQLLKMERKLYISINYDLTFPTPYRFLEIFKKKLNLDDKTFFLSQFLLESSLLDYNMIKYKYSELSAACLNLAMKINKIQNFNFEKVTKYNKEKLSSCIKEIILIIQKGEKDKLQAVRKKFSRPKFLEVAKIKI
jgi:cyclin B